MLRALGFVILVIGVVFLVVGLNATLSLTEKVVEGVSGRYSDNTTWYIIGGILLILGGGTIVFLRGNERK